MGRHRVERLRTAEAYWLATTGPDRAPHVVPVWGVLVDDDLYLETGAANTKKVRNLAANSAVAIHLDGINDALIVHGTAVACRPDAGSWKRPGSSLPCQVLGLRAGRGRLG